MNMSLGVSYKSENEVKKWENEQLMQKSVKVRSKSEVEE